MVADFYGARHELNELRQRFSISLKGVTLSNLVSHAAILGFVARPLRLDLSELKDLCLPCILHWDLSHFVVLRRVRGRTIFILDPAVGERALDIDKVSTHFTGVALELTPSIDFQPKRSDRISFRQLTGKISGLRRSLGQIFVVAVALEFFVIVAPLCNQMVVDEVLASGDQELLAVLVIGFGLLLAVQTSIGLARSWMILILTQSLSLQWMSNVFAHLIRLPLDYFEKRHLGDVTSRFSAIQAIQKTLTTGAIEAFLDGLMVLATLTMMFLYAPSLALITCSMVACYGLLRVLAYRPLRDASAERLILSAQENSYFLETIQAARPIKFFGREDGRRAYWQNLMVDVQNRDLRTAKLTIGFTTANTLLTGIENLLVLWVGANMVMNGQANVAEPFTVGMLLAYVSYKNQFCGRAIALINYGVELRMLGLHVERLSDIVLTPPEQQDCRVRDVGQISPTIELRNVSFRYADGEPWILRHASLKIEPQERVAIIGASGVGKTTLAKILLGVLSPIEGDVLYGGIPVSRLGIKNMRRFIGTVMQDDVLLSGSLTDNISGFDVQPDFDRVKDCAKLACIDEEIMKMPMAYQTLVGNLGSALSGGQKQRVLLARALYKQPQILVLDEGTSHLDLENEQTTLSLLNDLSVTRICIAHRPETISLSTRVLEIKKGHLHEKRAFDEARHNSTRTQAIR